MGIIILLKKKISDFFFLDFITLQLKCKKKKKNFDWAIS